MSNLVNISPNRSIIDSRPKDLSTGIANSSRQSKPIAINKDTVSFGQAEQTDLKAEKTKKRSNALSVAILLIGGAALGYGHKNQISAGIKKVSTWLNSGKTGEWIQKGKALFTKAKDAIMTKPPVA